MAQRRMTKSNDKKLESVSPSDKEEWGDFAKTASAAILLALLIRTFLFEPFNIPSGSMIPTLLVGDYLFVSKYEYGYSRYSFPFGLGGFEGRIMASEPNRGDVIVFKLPTDPSIDYIKRVVGMPGDNIQVTNGRLYINGDVVPREFVETQSYDSEDGSKITVTEYVETLPNGVTHKIFEEGDNMALDNTPVFTVPEGHYFMMGDNRDNSRDSRVQDLVGYVPFDHLVGRAEFLFFSTNGFASLFEPWAWPWTIRYDRLFDKIGNGEVVTKDQHGS